MKRLVVMALAMWMGLPGIARGAEDRKTKAIVFDALTIFDLSPLWSEAERQFPGKGSELAGVWRSRLFEYQWLRAAGGHYADFEHVTEDALVYAAKKQQIILSIEQRKTLLHPLYDLQAYPDAKPALQSLKAAGFRLAFLSNMTPTMLAKGIQASGLDGLFDAVLSTDQIKTYKPDPNAYRLGVDALALKPTQILFVPFAAWDLAGAHWFGYPTYWINHSAMPAEELDAPVQASGQTLNDLVQFVAPPPSENAKSK